MKRLLTISIALMVLATLASSQTVTGPTISKWAAGNTMPGRLIANGSIAWSLSTLNHDTDSSITTAVVDLTNQTRLAGIYLFNLTWTAAAGGSTGTQLVVTLYWHAASTDVAGASYAKNSVMVGGYGVTGSAAFTVTCGSAAAGTVPFLITTSAAAGSYPTPYFVPRYMSFALDKEGSTNPGHFSAGTVTLTWEAYSR